MDAACCQHEKTKRMLSQKSVSDMVNTTVLEKRRYYCKTIVDVIIFLASNRLALRGDWDNEENVEGGLFNSLFEFALNRNEKLIECQKHLPPNVTYKSPIIQNEFIDILASMVRDVVVKEAMSSDADRFTIFIDGTKDKRGDECISLAVRYVIGGKPNERLLFFETTKDLDAGAITELLLNSLKSYGLDARKILSQCYDGAAVMKGYKSGVAKRLSDKLEKIIPYVHCFNHRLHLTIVHTVNQIGTVKLFFDQLQSLYSFFKKPKVKSVYEGNSVKRLIDTRWTGHLEATKSVLGSFSEIVSTLDQVKSSKSDLDGEDIAMAIGLSSILKQKKFVFILTFMSEFLESFGPVDRLLQSRDISYHRAMPLVEVLQSTISEFRTDKNFSKFSEISDEMLSKFTEMTRPARRSRRRSTYLDDFVIEDTIGERANEADDIKATYFEIIDVTDKELKELFTENNEILLALSNSGNMDPNELKPLEKLGLKIPAEYELKTAFKFIEKKREEFLRQISKSNEKFDLLNVLYEFREIFPDVYKLYAAIDTFGCSTAICEASFSALASINIPSRVSMTNERMRNLAFLAFAHKTLKEISIDDVLHKFDKKKNRKIQLF